MTEVKIEPIALPFEEWLRVGCMQDDNLRVICHGILAVQNLRTKVVFVFGTTDEDA